MMSKSVFLSVLICVLISRLWSADLPPGFAEILVAQNLDPTAMAITPDGRIFIAEKKGRILIVENGQLLPDPFLVLQTDNYNERGLSGIAIDPHFEHNGYVYVYYTIPLQNRNRISRFRAIGNMATGTEEILIELDVLLSTVHNGGSMAFGADEKLYVSVGDGSDSGVPQSMSSLLGKVLRLNADGTIPSDNPFYHQVTGKYRAIYALGFRNTFSISIQPGTNRIFGSEVGNSTWEEVNEILPGYNYGWPIIEGPQAGQDPPQNYKDPVFAYNHSSGCAAVGAAFYNPSTNMFPPEYIGKFFFADYCRGYIKYIDPDVPGVANTFATNINRPLNIITAPDGTMYYLARAGIGGGSEIDNTSSNDGTLWRVFYTGSNKPFVSVNPQPVTIPVGEDARFFTAASGDEPLMYQWQRNETDIPGAIGEEYVLANAQLSDSGVVFRCIINNEIGSDTTAKALLRVTSNQRPLPEILAPIEGLLYRGGDTITFSGIASDPEKGQLTADALRWKIDFHHNTHTHPGLIPTAGISEGEYIIPQTGETASNVWYRIHMTATDDEGLSRTVTRDILPVKTKFNVETVPSGLPIYIESNFLTSPASDESVVGIYRTIDAIGYIMETDSVRIFRRWSDGVTTTSRTFIATDDTVTFTAIYDSYPIGSGTGLKAYYYKLMGWVPEFIEPFIFTRVDTTVNFVWGEGSPAGSELGNDNWLVRWEGWIEPILDAEYLFSVISDDGIRLWVNNELLIDKWVNQPALKWSGSIELQGGTKYPIRLEYFEASGNSVCKLFWSNPFFPESIIPKLQLYPESSSDVDETNDDGNVKIYPNPVRDILTIKNESGSAYTRVQLYTTEGKMLKARYEDIPETIEWDMRSLPKGLYWVSYQLENGKSRVRQIVVP